MPNDSHVITRRRPPAGGLLLAVAAAALLLLPAAEVFAQAPAAAGVTSEQVTAAVQKAVACLRQQQREDGNWPGAGHKGGTTALCLLALLNAGVDANDPAVLQGIAAINRTPNREVYVVSLKAQVYAAADPVKYANELRRAVAYLSGAQLDSGMWSYRRRVGRGDNSNTQFALLGLHEAANASATVPKSVWRKSIRHFINTQNPDGGWGYSANGGSYGSMTAAAIASLYIGGQRLNVAANPVFRNGAYPNCGKYAQNLPLAKGLAWMIRNFSVQRNPGRNSWYYYYMYALERVGMISGMRAFGRYDWYRLGAAELVGKQDNMGSWGRGQQIYDTAFGLLFLAKGNRPVLIQKVQWNGKWNRNIHDLENLTNFIGEKLGKHTTWQTTSLSLPLKELRAGPILLITGHEFPKFSPAEIEKLKQFVERAGGTLLFEACCGKKEFAVGFRAFAKKTWPDYHLRPLRKDHPVFSSLFPLADTCGLEGLDSGCRTAVFFSPRALSCLWELQTIPDHSGKALQLGSNIAAYATGRDQLRDKLDIVELPAVEKPDHNERRTEVPRGAVRIARLIHDGDYNADPHAIRNLARQLRDQAKIDIVTRSRHIHASDKAIYEYPIVFMNGHHAFKLSDKDISGLRDYLKKGGVLITSNCCGRKQFDESFRKMVAQLFPDNKLTALPEDHPIYTGKTGVHLGEVKYRPVLAKELGKRGATHPPLETIRIDGRTLILYSKYDWCCSLEGDRPFSCRGYVDEDGKTLAMSLFLYALSY